MRRMRGEEEIVKKKKKSDEKHLSSNKAITYLSVVLYLRFDMVLKLHPVLLFEIHVYNNLSVALLVLLS